MELDIDLEERILNDYIEFLEDYIISFTNTNTRYELFIQFVLEHIDW